MYVQSDKYWYDIMKELWPKFIPTKLNRYDRRPCQFVNLFGGELGCNYYSFLWSEVRFSFFFIFNF